MSLFPMFLKLESKPSLVVGAGKIGEPKIRSLVIARSKVRVIASRATAAVTAWAEAGVIEWEAREFRGDDLDGVFLTIAATCYREVNAHVFELCQSRRILCNVVDDPEHCDFYYGSVVRRGDLQLAISTNGQSPALAQRLRRELEAQFGPEYAGWLDHLGEARQQLFAQEMNSEERRLLLHELASRSAFDSAHSNQTSTEEKR